MKNFDQDIWVNIEDKTQDETFIQLAQQEFVGLPIAETVKSEDLGESMQTNRRDFLRYLGFGLGAATIAASCEIPVRRAIPYVSKPDTIVPGIANYYASSFVNGGDYSSILVKTREGRPIKIESNTLSKVTPTGTSARAQAMVLSLYDSARFVSAGKIDKGQYVKTSWDDLDKAFAGSINANSRIRIVTNTIISPSTKAVIAEFTAKFPNTKVVSYDPISVSGLLDANAQNFGERAVPDYRFDKAKTVVSFNADFLGTWISPEQFSTQWASQRILPKVEGASMSRLYMVENGMSLTGSNADNRILVKPSEQGSAILALYNEVASLTGGSQVSSLKLNDKASKAIKKVAAELVAQKGSSIVISGSNNTNEQVVVNKINELLGNYGNTIVFGPNNLCRQGSDSAIQGLIAEMSGNGVDAVFVWGANPSYDLPNSDKFTAALKSVPFSVSFALSMDESTANCKWVAPSHHNLESWGDAEPKKGHLSLVQPSISPIFKTRQPEESLLRWSGSALASSEQPYYEFLKSNWQNTAFGAQKSFGSFQGFWDSTLHDGVFGGDATAKTVSFSGDINAAAAGVSKPASSELEINFYESVQIGSGNYASNPWLQELPDPITRTVWGNYLSVPITWDGVNNFNGFKDLKDGDLVEITINGKKLTCAVVRQFGQMPGTFSLALGYGHSNFGTCANGVGVDAYPFLSQENGNTSFYSTKVTFGSYIGKEKDFASVQLHHTLGVTAMGKEEGKVINADEKALGYKGFQGSLTDRTVIRRANFKDLDKFVKELKEERAAWQHRNDMTLYPGNELEYTTGNHWGMHVDLNACTGCGACTIACMAENNVPVVGKHEVHRHHEMSWLRIDRYYYGDVENPNVVYQPMMCQHCDNAPCENVCPVAATNHSSEGLNQMTYNRCIGTRYCANNCPYKVRRFNWLDYTTADLFPANEPTTYGEDLNFKADNLVRMVLNPDVTVRSRGVIEKCSFCVQRIQEGKLTSKKENRVLRDSDVRTACQTACPTGAIVFGNTNNPDGDVSKLLKRDLNYIVLEEINVKSNVTYTAKIINKNETIG
jgi:MoCo/4Fe-4S cofactor protein with predicted Tat translocation signal